MDGQIVRLFFALYGIVLYYAIQETIATIMNIFCKPNKGCILIIQSRDFIFYNDDLSVGLVFNQIL